MEQALLEVSDLRTSFATEDGAIPAVDGVTFGIDAGRTLGIVGESGCGKSVTGLSIMRLVRPPGRIVSGSIRFAGEEMLTKSDDEMRAIRGDRISMIFQEPMTSLNPVFTVGFQIGEAIGIHRAMTHRQIRDRVIELLQIVGIPSPEQRVDDYPHQMSGGMRQRVMIAMALCCDPQLLIADEPTTALDVTIQAQILELLKSLQRRFATAILLITHDLGVIAEAADEVAVMYLGRIVERAPVKSLFFSPRHPYTLGLLRSTPRLDRSDERLQEIRGTVPNPLAGLTGCRFHTRCERASEVCRAEEPAYRPIAPGSDHWVRCWHAEGTA
ncbi:MAG: ABC transporter ATP-binding protein [Alphaproteobacteria bacterium]|nr:ABC transporter ATP-binding protein [Alphaproteobacteria bacterium]